MTTRRKSRRRIGDIVKILLPDNFYCFGRVLQEPLVAFYDLHVREIPDIDVIISSPILFKVWVMNSAITTGRWVIVGNRDVDDRTATEPEFFKQDTISKKYSRYFNNMETPATKAECIGLECAAVWDAEHVEERLVDHYAGRPNKWVESLKPT